MSGQKCLIPLYVLRNEVETDDIIGAPTATPADIGWRTPGTGRSARSRARHGGIREPVPHFTTLVKQIFLLTFSRYDIFTIERILSSDLNFHFDAFRLMLNLVVLQCD